MTERKKTTPAERANKIMKGCTWEEAEEIGTYILGKCAQKRIRVDNDEKFFERINHKICEKGEDWIVSENGAFYIAMARFGERHETHHVPQMPGRDYQISMAYERHQAEKLAKGKNDSPLVDFFAGTLFADTNPSYETAILLLKKLSEHQDLISLLQWNGVVAAENIAYTIIDELYLEEK